jgi:hypothetical protein
MLPACRTAGKGFAIPSFDVVPREHLHHLQASELLYESRLAPERVYTFTQALTPEVAYQSL